MFLSGLGPSLFHPLALGALTLKFPKQRGFLVSLHGSGGSTGEVLGPIIAGGLLTGAIFITLSWNDILKWSIVPAVVVGFIIWLVVRDLTNTKGNVESFSEYITNLSSILKNKPLQICWPKSFVPCAHDLEKKFYFDSKDIVKKILTNFK